MGVDNLRTFLRDKGVYKKEDSVPIAEFMSSLSPEIKIHVDIMGTFYSQLGKVFASGKVNPFLKILDSTFSTFKDKIILVMDGHRTREKYTTHLERDETKIGTLHKLDRHLEKGLKMETRPRRQFYKTAEDLLKATVVPDPETKKLLVASIRDAGYNIELAYGEADVCIATVHNAVAMSIDSDFFIHPRISSVLIPFLVRGSLSVWKVDRSTILHTLGLQSRYLTALGIVSENDYAKNPTDFALGRNLPILLDIQKEFARSSPNRIPATKRIIERYVAKVREKRPVLHAELTAEHFCNAVRIFVYQEESRSNERSHLLAKRHQLETKYQTVKDYLKTITRKRVKTPATLFKSHPRNPLMITQYKGPSRRLNDLRTGPPHHPDRITSDPTWKIPVERSRYSPLLHLMKDTEKPVAVSDSMDDDNNDTTSENDTTSNAMDVDNDDNTAPIDSDKCYKADEVKNYEDWLSLSVVTHEVKEPKKAFDPSKRDDYQDAMVASGRIPINGFSRKARKTTANIAESKQSRKPADLKEAQKSAKTLFSQTSVSSIPGGSLKSFLQGNNPNGQLWRVFQKRLNHLQVVLRLTEKSLEPVMQKTFSWGIDMSRVLISKSGGSDAFIQSIMTFWHRRICNESDKSTQEDPFFITLKSMYANCYPEVDLTEVDREWFSADVFQSMAKQLSTNLGGLMNGRMSELKAKVDQALENNEEFTSEQRDYIRWVLPTLDPKTPDTFFLMNSLLPVEKRLKVVPDSGFVNNFTSMSELEIFSVLVGSDNINTLRVSNWSLPTGQEERTFTRDTLRKQPGRFFYFLLSFRPDMDNDSIVYQWRTKKSDQTQQFKATRKFIFLENADVSALASTFKGFQDDPNPATHERFVLSNVMKTNGVEFWLLFHDRFQRPKSTLGEGQLGFRSTTARFDNIPDVSKWPKEKFANILSRASNPSHKTCLRRECKCSKCQVTMKRDDYLKARDIKGARSLTIPGSDNTCSALDCGCESCRKPIYVGIDTGERFTFGSTTIHTATKSFQTMAVNARALNRPRRNLRASLEKAKARDKEENLGSDYQSSVRDIEASLGDVLKNSDPQVRLQEYSKVYAKLSEFYNSNKLSRKRYQAKVAHRSEWDKVVHQILTTVDGSCNSRVRNQPVFFGIGGSQVKGEAGPFIRYLVTKLRSHGYCNIFLVNEDYTSQKCCQCGSQTIEPKGTQRRVKHCNDCSVHYHRDILAGHNISNVLQSYVEEGVRPAYLPLRNQS